MEKTKASKFLALLTILFISSLSVMAASIISPALPKMTAYFKATPNAEFLVKLTSTIPALFIALGSFIAGILIDKIGRKPLLIFSMLLYSLSGASGFFIDSLLLMLITRGLLGLGVAGMITSTTTLIGDYYEASERSKIIGLQRSAMGIGGIVLLLLGGVLSDVDWRIPFLVYLVGLITIPFILIFIYEPEHHKIEHKEAKTTIKAPFPIGLILLICFITFIDVSIFYLIPVQLPFYVESIKGINNTFVGIAMAINMLFSAISSFFYGKLKSRLSFEILVVLSALFTSIGLAVISASTIYIVIVIGLAVSGIGFGLFMPNTNSWIIAKTDDSLRGRGIGMLNLFAFMGQFLSPIINQPLAQVGLSFNYLIGGMVMFAMCIIFFVKSFRS